MKKSLPPKIKSPTTIASVTLPPQGTPGARQGCVHIFLWFVPGPSKLSHELYLLVRTTEPRRNSEIWPIQHLYLTITTLHGSSPSHPKAHQARGNGAFISFYGSCPDPRNFHTSYIFWSGPQNHGETARYDQFNTYISRSPHSTSRHPPALRHTTREKMVRSYLFMVNTRTRETLTRVISFG